jgi:hypothetical protein
MLCGVSRRSPRSLLASLSFFAAALATVNSVSSPLSQLILDGGSPACKTVIPEGMYLSGMFGLVISLYDAHAALTWYMTRIFDNPRYTASIYTARPTQTMHRAQKSPDPAADVVTHSEVTRHMPYFLSGMTFSLGLLLSGMVSPLKVLGFLHFAWPAHWPMFDPSLAMVILLPNAFAWIYLRKRLATGCIPYSTDRMTERSPISLRPYLPWESWRVPSRSDIDWRLITGSVIFGIGWGLGGVCPGPAVVGLGEVAVGMLAGNERAGGYVMKGICSFLGAMILGMAAARLL